MHGNLDEWCNDWYAYYSGAETNPAGPATGAFRVVRGGNWFNVAPDCRSAYRKFLKPELSGSYRIGFRPVWSVD
jgi:formylglycine-generating enzyme required for sulfatase activity